MFINYCN